MESTKKKYQMILASGSPRRKELLGHLGINFKIQSSDIEEITSLTEPCEVVEDLAKQKGEATFKQIDKEVNPLVIASDTIVTLDGVIYGKPTDLDDARRILKELSGRTHEVMTGVYISHYNSAGEYEYHTFSCTTEVTFEPFDEDLIYHYLQTGDSMDKAGAYGIQQEGLTFIKSISGSYSNVVGFPLSEFVKEIRLFLGNSKEWRSLFL